MAIQQASATWTGSLKEGTGQFTLPKAQYTGQFTFADRFENGNGTNPEELVGAALSACFSMFLTAILGKDGHRSNSVNTHTTVTLESQETGPAITSISLRVEADVEGMDDSTFQTYVESAKNHCPISKLYAGTSLSVAAKLLQSAS